MPATWHRGSLLFHTCTNYSFCLQCSSFCYVQGQLLPVSQGSAQMTPPQRGPPRPPGLKQPFLSHSPPHTHNILFVSKNHDLKSPSVDYLIVCISPPLVAQSVKNPCNAGDPGLIPGFGRSPGEGNDYPLQYSCLEKPHGQRSTAGYSPWGCKSQTWLSDSAWNWT